MEVLDGGGIVGTVGGVLGACGVVGELREAVVVRVWHEHHRLKVEGLARAGEAACITHEACVHLTCGGKVVAAG